METSFKIKEILDVNVPENFKRIGKVLTALSKNQKTTSLSCILRQVSAAIMQS